MTDMINGAFMEDLGEILNAVTGPQRKTLYEADQEFEKMTETLVKKANLRVRGITLSTQNCIQAGSCSQGGLGHINKHNSESSTLRTNFCHGPVTGTVTEISSRTEFVHFALCDAADVRELDAVVDAVGRGVGPDDGPDLADTGFEHSARHDTRNRRSGRSSAGASPAAAGPSHHC